MTKQVEKGKPEAAEVGTEKQLKCGLVMPISAIDSYSESHWAEVKKIIIEALQGTNFTVELVSDADDVGVIQNRIVSNLYSSDIVICDVSAKNPNVMFELGMRLAFDKPTIIIKDDRTNYTFDTSVIEHIGYRSDLHYPSIVEFKTILRKKVEHTYLKSQGEGYTTFLKHFGSFKIATVPERVISSDDFVVNSLEKLTATVRNIELKLNYAGSPTGHKSPSILKALDTSLSEVFSDNSYSPNSLVKNRSQIIETIADKLNEEYGSDRNWIKVEANQIFERLIKSQQSD